MINYQPPAGEFQMSDSSYRSSHKHQDRGWWRRLPAPGLLLSAADPVWRWRLSRTPGPPSPRTSGRAGGRRGWGTRSQLSWPEHRCQAPPRNLQRPQPIIRSSFSLSQIFLCFKLTISSLTNKTQKYSLKVSRTAFFFSADIILHFCSTETEANLNLIFYKDRPTKYWTRLLTWSPTKVSWLI